VFDPQVVLLAGGLIEGHGGFISDVEERVQALLHFGFRRRPQVRAAAAGRLAGVQGAAALVFETGQNACIHSGTVHLEGAGSSPLEESNFGQSVTEAAAPAFKNGR
jgi:hypothetical protein